MSSTATTKVYKEHGGGKLVVASGGVINVEAGGEVQVDGVTFLDSSMTLPGAKRKVTASAIAMSGIDESYSGSVITNEGAAAARVFALSAAVVGVELTFVVMAAQELRIDPSGTETIALPSSGAQSAAGKYISADAVGEWVKLLCVKTGQWQVVGYHGTWTAEG